VFGANLPRQTEIHFGADVTGVALHPALIVYRRPGRKVCLGSEDNGGVRVDFLCRPRRARDPGHGERRRDVVHRPEAELGATIPIVADIGRYADVGPAAAVEVIDAGAEDRRPAIGSEAACRIVPVPAR